MQGKESQVVIGGILITKKKIEKERKRYGIQTVLDEGSQSKCNLSSMKMVFDVKTATDDPLPDYVRVRSSREHAASSK